jgi:hypothetical protein
MPLFTFWRNNWQSLILGLVVFMGALALLFSGLVWSVLCAMEYRKHQTWWAARRNTQQYFRENILAPGLAYVMLIPIFGAVYWPYSIYANEHKKVERANADSKGFEDAYKDALRVNASINAEIRKKRENFDRKDPLFSNTVYFITAFKAFEERTRVPTGNDCNIRVTAPQETLEFVETLQLLWKGVVNCAGDGPFVPGYDPDRDKETRSGMIPDQIVFHAVAGDGAADGLFNDLRKYLPLHRVFYGTEADIPHHKVWLQFGSKVDRIIKDYK